MAMKLQRIVSPTLHAAAATAQTVARLAKLEPVLAFVCLFTPALLIGSDGGPFRSRNRAITDRLAFPWVVYTVLGRVAVVRHHCSALHTRIMGRARLICWQGARPRVASLALELPRKLGAATTEMHAC